MRNTLRTVTGDSKEYFEKGPSFCNMKAVHREAVFECSIS